MLVMLAKEYSKRDVVDKLSLRIPTLDGQNPEFTSKFCLRPLNQKRRGNFKRQPTATSVFPVRLAAFFRCDGL
ncbi:MAG TPA: hypothetical protein VFC07_15455 [Verrucomicrobiae bacterium]|nr:hypothetical protein [Verrucomicrobiae bacterium]